MNLRVSDFCHFVDGDNNLTALYNALTLGVVIIDRETASILRQAKGRIITETDFLSLSPQDTVKLLDKLIENKLVVPLEQQTDLNDYQQIQQGLDCKRIGIVYLLMTDACNLNCSYCFFENGIPEGYQFSTMSGSVARYGIDIFAKALADSHGVDEPQIIFYGGEPLLNLIVMKKTLAYIKQLREQGGLPSNTSVTVNTNGTLINDEVVSVFRGVDNLNVAISLDGPKDVHDACRKYHHSGGTYDDIMRGYQKLADGGIGVGFCCTISRHNVDRLEEIARWFVDELNATSMGFNILIENPRVDEVRGDMETYARVVTEKIINCFLFFRERGVHEDRIMRKVNAFVDGYVYYYDCGGCGQQIVVAPDGRVGVCQGYCGTKKYFVEPDSQFNPLEHPIWELWRHRSPLFMQQCKNCIALSICGGGCPYSADQRHGSIWELDDVFCVHAKATAEFLIQDLIRQTSS